MDEIEQLKKRVAELERLVVALLDHTHVIHWPKGGSPVSRPVTTAGFDLPGVSATRVR